MRQNIPVYFLVGSIIDVINGIRYKYTPQHYRMSDFRGSHSSLETKDSLFVSDLEQLRYDLHSDNSRPLFPVVARNCVHPEL
jgi:hypothetical protein